MRLLINGLMILQNDNHDERGRFTSADNAAHASAVTKAHDAVKAAGSSASDALTNSKKAETKEEHKASANQWKSVKLQLKTYHRDTVPGDPDRRKIEEAIDAADAAIKSHEYMANRDE